jgi:hypothetical protein
VKCDRDPVFTVGGDTMARTFELTQLDIKGSIPALVTPFSNGAVDFDAFAAFVDWQIREGSTGLVPCGTTGESPTLTHAEHYDVITCTVEVAAGRVPVIASTASTGDRAKLDYPAPDGGSFFLPASGTPEPDPRNRALDDLFDTDTILPAVPLGDKEQPVLGHLTGHALKKIRAEIGRIAVLQVGALVATVEKGPVLGRNVRPARPSELHAGVLHFAALLLDFFALFLAQGA